METFRKAYLAGETCKFLFFWGHTPSGDGRIHENGLSQWWMCRFVLDGVGRSCAEQYMMAEKARMFDDLEMWGAIVNAKHPKEMKACGRAARASNPEIRDARCDILGRNGYAAKFGQNSEWWAFPAGTKNRSLVEASPRDCILGIGRGKIIRIHGIR